ncbi:hypothetical protein F5Y16DRAFT_323916 [Xylariaceae sp. FL0255]|nr:hypothetical protein F5Y16DRAFT_323916 [Xylariaceae sp. FL0255]
MAKTRKSSPEPIQNQPPILSTLDIKAHPKLGYKLRALLNDFHTMAKNPDAEIRLSESTDELYLGAPYFTPEESAIVKAAKVTSACLSVVSDSEPETQSVETAPEPSASQKRAVSTATSSAGRAQISNAQETISQISVEEVIQLRWQNFFEKRRASGDARPCGPHDLAPAYLRVFGVSVEELSDEKFLSRFRRMGLRDETLKPATDAGGSNRNAQQKPNAQKNGKGKGKGKQKQKSEKS